MLLTGANAEWWTHVPTFQTVTVNSASISLPVLQCARSSTIQGGPSVKLESYEGDAPFPLPASAQVRPDFTIPGTHAC